MMRIARASLFAMALLACGATPDRHGTTPAPKSSTAAAGEDAGVEDDGTVCREESVTGSNMTRTVCRTREQRDRDRKDAQDFSSKSSRIQQTKRN